MFIKFIDHLINLDDVSIISPVEETSHEDDPDGMPVFEFGIYMKNGTIIHSDKYEDEEEAEGKWNELYDFFKRFLPDFHDLNLE